MTALALWAIRLIVLFVIIRIVMSFLPRNPASYSREKKKTTRYDAKGDSVEDGDFKEL